MVRLHSCGWTEAGPPRSGVFACVSARMVIPLFSAQTPRPHPTPSRSTSCWPQPTASQSYPSGLPLHGPGASPPALPPPRLPFLHLEDACGWTGWSQAGAAPSLTQAPRPLTDPNAACPAPAARRTRVGGGCQGGVHSGPRARAARGG